MGTHVAAWEGAVSKERVYCTTRRTSRSRIERENEEGRVKIEILWNGRDKMCQMG